MIRKRERERERERESRDRLHREPATPTSSSVLDIIMHYETDNNGELVTPTLAWRAAKRLAKVAMMRKYLNRSTCAMCLQTMKPRQGHAIFTVECSHTFHFSLHRFEREAWKPGVPCL
ncbi:hypothetical protein SUGI_0486150 [Cryptomeria japonica]|nr:hypothetical protein SUGI_0486150 [Cryptomeria japonica]